MGNSNILIVSKAGYGITLSSSLAKEGIPAFVCRSGQTPLSDLFGLGWTGNVIPADHPLMIGSEVSKDGVTNALSVAPAGSTIVFDQQGIPQDLRKAFLASKRRVLGGSTNQSRFAQLSLVNPSVGVPWTRLFIKPITGKDWQSLSKVITADRNRKFFVKSDFYGGRSIECMDQGEVSAAIQGINTNRVVIQERKDPDRGFIVYVWDMKMADGWAKSACLFFKSSKTASGDLGENSTGSGVVIRAYKESNAPILEKLRASIGGAVPEGPVVWTLYVDSETGTFSVLDVKFDFNYLALEAAMGIMAPGGLVNLLTGQTADWDYDNCGAAIRMYLSTWPSSEYGCQYAVGYVVSDPEPTKREQVLWCDVYKDWGTGTMRVAGQNGMIATVTGVGYHPKEAIASAVSAASTVRVEGVQFRTDVCKRSEEREKMLRKFGHIKGEHFTGDVTVKTPVDDLPPPPEEGEEGEEEDAGDTSRTVQADDEELQLHQDQ